MQAMAIPIKPDKLDAWLAWCAEMNGARASDLAEFNARHGLTTHAAFHQSTPDGQHLAVIVIDGPGADTFLAELAASEHEVDAWFRMKIEEIHPMDFANIPPMPERKF